MRSLIRSKIHLATVTEANVDYVGSITIDNDLIEATGLWVGEKVIIMGFEITDKPVKPKVILCNRENGIAEVLGERAGMILTVE